MNSNLLTMILIAAVVVVATSVIAKVLGIGSAIDQRGDVADITRSCCISGWAKIAEAVRESRDQGSAPPHKP